MKTALLIFAAVVVLALPQRTAAQVKSTAYQVNLSWQAPTGTTDPVASYEVFRLLVGSGLNFAVIGTAPLTPTAYTDLGIVGGQTYEYMVESVDAGGVTSAPSNTATVPILPFPPTVGQATVVSTP